VMLVCVCVSKSLKSSKLSSQQLAVMPGSVPFCSGLRPSCHGSDLSLLSSCISAAFQLLPRASLPALFLPPHPTCSWPRCSLSRGHSAHQVTRTDLTLMWKGEGRGLLPAPAWEEGGGPRPPTALALTEHGHELLGVQVPVAPVGPVTVQRGVLLVVVCRFCPKGVDDSNSAPVPGD
jgi:hypothetical protein